MRKRFLLWIFTFVILLSGCQENERVVQESSQSEIPEEPLVVFYSSDEKDIIENYKINFPDDNVKFYSIDGALDSSYVTMEGTEVWDRPILKAINNRGIPDVLLVGSGSGIEKLYHEINGVSFLNMKELYQEDESFDLENYFPGILETGMVGEELVAFPLEITIPYLTMSEEMYQNSAFANLPEAYTGTDVLEAAIEELSKEREEGAYCVFSDDGFYPSLRSLNVIEYNEDGSMMVDENVFSLLYEEQRLALENERSLWDLPYEENPRLTSMKLFPWDNPGGFLAVGWRDAPQVGCFYAANANEEWFKQRTRFIWCPSAADGNKYGAEVKLFGVINQDSAQQERAYNFLRNMMDMPIQYWTKPNEYGEYSYSSYCPVNKEQAKAMLQTVNDSNLNQMSLQKYTAGSAMPETYIIEKGRALYEEECAEIINVLDNITYFYNCKSWDDPVGKAAEQMQEQIYNGVTNPTGVYQSVLNALNQ